MRQQFIFSLKFPYWLMLNCSVLIRCDGRYSFLVTWLGVGIYPFLVRKYVFLFPKKDTLSHSNSSHPSDSQWEDNIAIFWADDWPWFTVTSNVVHWHVIQWNAIWISDPICVIFFFQIHPTPPQMSERISVTICCNSCRYFCHHLL